MGQPHSLFYPKVMLATKISNGGPYCCLLLFLPCLPLTPSMRLLQHLSANLLKKTPPKNSRLPIFKGRHRDPVLHLCYTYPDVYVLYTNMTGGSHSKQSPYKPLPHRPYKFVYVLYTYYQKEDEINEMEDICILKFSVKSPSLSPPISGIRKVMKFY